MEQIIFFMAQMMSFEHLEEKMAQELEEIKLALLAGDNEKANEARKGFGISCLIYNSKQSMEMAGVDAMTMAMDHEKIKDAHDKMNFDKDDKQN
jgi:hypothetical protein